MTISGGPLSIGGNVTGSGSVCLPGAGEGGERVEVETVEALGCGGGAEAGRGA